MNVSKPGLGSFWGKRISKGQRICLEIPNLVIYNNNIEPFWLHCKTSICSRKECSFDLRLIKTLLYKTSIFYWIHNIHVARKRIRVSAHTSENFNITFLIHNRLGI